MDKTYCIFGDSVAQAAYVNAGWVELLRRYLENKYFDSFVNVFNLGIGGNTTDDVLKRFEGEASVRNPDSIIFAIGINDTKDYNPELFVVNLIKLVDTASRFTKDINFVGLVLGDWRGDEPFSCDSTAEYNKLIEKITQQKGGRFISLQEKLLAEDFADGLHPNKQGHKKMFEVIREYF
ncbi:MAG: SGNH/GDSL hydrolase family protein [Candidatus Shapirobacteria bacterium]|jgi:lysophospholipase L1-like esterase